MPKKKLTCPKCDSSMEAGWISEGSVQKIFWAIPALYHTCWIPGSPRTKKDGTKTWKTEREQSIKALTAYRCESCGYVETYAH